jgi:hypothetical protein
MTNIFAPSEADVYDCPRYPLLATLATLLKFRIVLPAVPVPHTGGPAPADVNTWPAVPAVVHARAVPDEAYTTPPSVGAVEKLVAVPAQSTSEAPFIPSVNVAIL